MFFSVSYDWDFYTLNNYKEYISARRELKK